ncbi:MAG: adenylate/guanylate cyclase domain-containing protein [Deltaproteobacteria bacterium]|nr:adenylate/guanylate cyclase domain-containing protein [Deltaproteobacteria bacterium]
MKAILKKLFRLNALALSLMLAVLIIIVYVIGVEYLEVMELKARDLRFQIRGEIQPGPEVILAVVDEKSLDELGRWPWPRSKIADVIKALDADGAKVVGFDIVFAEPDINDSLKLINRLENEIKTQGVNNKSFSRLLEKEKKLADNDLILAQTISEADIPVILGYFLRVTKDRTVAHITEEQVQAQIDRLHNSHYAFARLSAPNVELQDTDFTRAFMPVANIPILSDSAVGSGYMNTFPDIDGTVRWLPLVIQVEDKFYLPLSLQILRYYLDDAPASIYVSELGVEKVNVGPYELPTDEFGRYLINFRGPTYTFPHYSMSDIVSGNFKPGTFKDKIVLAGVTAQGVYDMRVTPFETGYPGLEIHANVLDSILKKDFLTSPHWSSIFDLLVILLTALVLGLVLPKLSAVPGLVFAFIVLGAEGGMNYFFFTRGLWLNLIHPVMSVILIYIGVTVFRYITEEREQRRIKGAFTTYVYPSVVEEMLKHPEMLKLGGEKKVLTVLFSDIKGFTTISEQMEPDALIELLNEYLTPMTDLVFKYDGLLDKYIGDAIMSVYGAPLEMDDHALKACRTSLEMMEKMRELRQMWAETDPTIPYVDCRIGINTGIIVVGNMGSHDRFDYTAVGDDVNLASRLEGAGKEYDTNIIIGATTYEQVKGEMVCRELDLIEVVGKTRPVRIYELLAEDGQASKSQIQLVNAFQQGLRAYQGQQWDRAINIFSQINGHFPEDGPTKVFLKRVSELRKNPPPKDWDGVYVMTHK